ncbi:MAG: hypothetical protein J5833_02155 [Victivallales bacterium]|nr:hypothetical protein [Victivallales bacterium]
MKEDFKEAIAAGEGDNDDGKLTPEEQKFLAMLDEGRPAPLADDTSESDAVPQESTRLGILKILAYAVIVVAVIGGVYCFFPKQHIGKTPIERCHSIDEIPAEAFADERYGSIMHDALEAYFKGDFNRCVSAIHSQLSGIVADRQSNENAYDLLSLYIHTLRFADLSPSMRRESIELLNSLSREDPDNATWRIACIRITYSDILDYRRIYEQSKTRLLDWNERLYRCNHALSECQNLEKVQRKKIQLAEDDYKPRLRSELADILAIQCAIFTSKWLLEGGEGKSSLPDDAGDRGVDSRELAVRIAMDKDADCGKFKALTPEFLEIRNFIATTVKSQANGLFNSYYWNGEKHSSITPLQREIVNTAAKLRKLKKAR